MGHISSLCVVNVNWKSVRKKTDRGIIAPAVVEILSQFILSSYMEWLASYLSHAPPPFRDNGTGTDSSNWTPCSPVDIKNYKPNIQDFWHLFFSQLKKQESNPGPTVSSASGGQKIKQAKQDPEPATNGSYFLLCTFHIVFVVACFRCRNFYIWKLFKGFFGVLSLFPLSQKMPPVPPHFAVKNLPILYMTTLYIYM